MPRTTYLGSEESEPPGLDSRSRPPCNNDSLLFLLLFKGGGFLSS